MVSITQILLLCSIPCFVCKGYKCLCRRSLLLAVSLSRTSLLCLPRVVVYSGLYFCQPYSHNDFFMNVGFQLIDGKVYNSLLISRIL